MLSHYSMWFYLGQATGTSALSLAPHSTNHPLPHMVWERLGKNFPPPHCSCIQPCSCHFVVEMNPCFKRALYVVPCMLAFIHALKQPFSWNNPGYIPSAQKDCVSACWQRTWLSTCLTHNPPAAAPTKRVYFKYV